MKKSKIKKMFVTVIAVILVFAFSTTALAYSSFSTISASSSSSQVKKANISRAYSTWRAEKADSYFTGFNDSVKLTVRPYEAGTSTKVSNAKTFSKRVEYGGQDYWDNPPSSVDVKANSTEDGVLCGVTGTLRF